MISDWNLIMIHHSNHYYLILPHIKAFLLSLFNHQERIPLHQKVMSCLFHLWFSFSYLLHYFHSSLILDFHQTLLPQLF